MPSDTHENICRRLRQRLTKEGYRESKNPLPNYRFDVYARRITLGGKLTHQVVVEAEIPSTLFKEHTIDQLQSMCKFMRHEHKRGVKTRGILAVPRDSKTSIQARLLLRNIGSTSERIELVEVSAN